MTEEKSTLPAVVAASNYALMRSESSGIAQAVQANLGSGGISPFELDNVHVPAGGTTTWEVPSLSGPQEVKDLEGIIVHWKTTRSYWSESYDDSGGGTPPECSSEDCVVGYGTPGGLCVACPLSKFGTARKGGGQACRQMQLLFLVRESDHLPIVMVVPPSSLKEVKQYFLRLSMSGIAYHDVVTRLSLKKATNKGGLVYSAILPTMAAKLGPDEIAHVREYAKGLAPIFSAARIDSSAISDD